MKLIINFEFGNIIKRICFKDELNYYYIIIDKPYYKINVNVIEDFNPLNWKI